MFYQIAFATQLFRRSNSIILEEIGMKILLIACDRRENVLKIKNVDRHVERHAAVVWTAPLDNMCTFSATCARAHAAENVQVRSRRQMSIDINADRHAGCMQGACRATCVLHASCMSVDIFRKIVPMLSNDAVHTTATCSLVGGAN